MKILIAGFSYVRKSYLDVFKYYPGDDNLYFLLPKTWKVKDGKVVYYPPVQDNVYTTGTYFYHSHYPLLGGLLKGWMPYLPFFLFRQRKKKFDILFSATEPSLLTTLYQGIWAKIFGIKHVLATWENISYQSKFHGLNLLSKIIIIKLNMFLSDGIVCGNKKGAVIMKEFTKNPIAVIPMSGVDKYFFKRLELEKFFKGHDFRGKMVYSFVGSISHRKGIHLIIRALKDVIKKIPNAVLFIAGSGEYEIEIDRVVKETGMASHIFRAPWISHEEMRELLSISDVFVYPSLPYKGWAEQLGYSTMEASLMELPVITTHSGSLDEVVVDNKTGILIAPDNLNELREAMIKLGSDENLRKMLGTEARRFMIENFGHDVVAAKFEKFFHSLTN